MVVVRPFGWLDWIVQRVHAPIPPFDCAWCDGNRHTGDRHDMCSGKSLRPHREYLAFFSVPKVTDCSCALRGHSPPPPPSPPLI